MFSSTTCLTVVFSCGMAPAPYFRRRTVRDHFLHFCTLLYIFYFTIIIICHCLPGVPKSDSRPAWRWRRFFISSVEDTILELGGSGVLLLRHRVRSPWQTPIIYYIMYITVI